MLLCGQVSSVPMIGIRKNGDVRRFAAHKAPPCKNIIIDVVGIIDINLSDIEVVLRAVGALQAHWRPVFLYRTNAKHHQPVAAINAAKSCGIRPSPHLNGEVRLTPAKMDNRRVEQSVVDAYS